jgi:hypothetical protein
MSNQGNLFSPEEDGPVPVAVELEVTHEDLAYGHAIEVFFHDNPDPDALNPPDPASIWRGFAGESATARYFKQHARTFRWIEQNGYKEPDFIINGIGTDLKTGCRIGPPLREPDYNVAVTKRQLDRMQHPTLCFGSWDTCAEKFYLLGGIDLWEFKEKSKLYRKGATVNLKRNGEPFKARCDSYIMEIGYNLTTPLIWLRELERRR